MRRRGRRNGPATGAGRRGPRPAPRGAPRSSQRSRAEALRHGHQPLRPPLRPREKRCRCPQPRWRPRPPRPSVAARGVCRNAGGAGDVARPGPLRRPAAARRCPAATHRGPGRLRAEAAAARRELGEAEGAVGGGVGQPLSPGSGRRGSAGLLPRPAGGRERPRPASLPGQPLICERRRCLGPPGSGAGCGARGWREQGGGCRCRAGAQACGGRQCPSGGGGEPRYHCRFSPRPQGSGVPSQQPCCFTRPADSPQKRKLATRLLRLRGDNVRGESDATCRCVIPEVVCGL